MSRTSTFKAICILSAALWGGSPLWGQDRPATPDAPPENTIQTREGATVTPAGAQPPVITRPAAPSRQPQPPAPPEEDEIIIAESSEPVDLKTLVEYIAETMEITIVASDQLTGQVTINAPNTLRRDQLLPFLDALLEQQGFTIVQDRPGFYRIIKTEDIRAWPFGEEEATTRVFTTPTLRPSSLKGLIDNQIAKQGQVLRIAYLDDLGIIVATESPRRMQVLEELIGRVLDRAHEQEFIRFELQHIAASVARSRVLDLVGQQQQLNPFAPPVIQPIPEGQGVTAAIMTNLADRLSIDPQGNALILRGYATEANRIQQLLLVLDVPNLLEPRQYHAGSAALEIAQFAQRVGLGSVESIDTGTVGGLTAPPGGRPLPQQQQQFQQFPQFQQQPTVGGPVLVVDPSRGTITYFGTPAQHAQLAATIQAFDVGRDVFVIETYKLKNSPAIAVAEVIQAILTNEPAETTSAFLAGAGGRERGAGGRRGTTGRTGQQTNLLGQQQQLGQLGGQGRGGQQRGDDRTGISSFGLDEIFVVADRANNQLLVKAPKRQQSEFAKLIERLDQRRPQVYINVQIVAVTDTDAFRLAVETQLINAGGTGGVINTNFGLARIPEDGNNILERKTVPLSLSGFTAAIIKSDYVPIVINALKQETDARILSSPQLLVDDNESAEIVSLEEQPTATETFATNTTSTTFAGYESAGTTLFVTPSISEAGYMRLEYDIELSNFFGTGTGNVPPPRQTRNVSSDSVTIPDGSTIVVGGISVDSRNTTVVKVPLLGDIPLLGHLFRDTSKNTSSTRLYVFITPTILRDPSFRDLILLSKGPQAEAGISPDMPDLETVYIEMVDSRPARGAPPPAPIEPDPLNQRIPRAPETPEALPARENLPEPELPTTPMQ